MPLACNLHTLKRPRRTPCNLRATGRCARPGAPSSQGLAHGLAGELQVYFTLR